MEIRYPDMEERNQSIQRIIQTAYPKKPSLIPYFCGLYKQIGIENLVHNMGYMFFSAGFLYCIAFTYFQYLMDSMTKGMTSLLLLVFSPMVFQVMLGLFILNEKEQRVFDLETTCKYTIFHVLALRMILTSIVLVIVNAVWCCLLFRDLGGKVILHILCLSVTALGLYGVCYLGLLMRSIRVSAQVFLYAMWIVTNGLLKLILPEGYIKLTMELPIVYHVFIWMALVLIYGRLFSDYLTRATGRIYMTR